MQFHKCSKGALLNKKTKGSIDSMQGVVEGLASITRRGDSWADFLKDEQKRARWVGEVGNPDRGNSTGRDRRAESTWQNSDRVEWC